jgi:hypothetical protein
VLVSAREEDANESVQNLGVSASDAGDSRHRVLYVSHPADQLSVCSHFSRADQGVPLLGRGDCQALEQADSIVGPTKPNCCGSTKTSNKRLAQETDKL